jgi:hypothetical protein
MLARLRRASLGLEYDEEMSSPLRDPSVLARTSALDIPAGPSAGSQYLWARFARPGPLCRPE